MLLQLHRYIARRLSTSVQPVIYSTSAHHVSRPLTRVSQHPSIVRRNPWHLPPSPRWASTSPASSLPSINDPTSPSQAIQTTEIRVLNLTSHQDRVIKRSFPKGKPENLVQGLERLTAQATVEDEETGKRQKRRDAWHLRSSGDAICRYLAIWQPEYVNKLKHEIGNVSQEIGHHPHYMLRYQQNREVCIFVIMCTTHVPHGLSLKDVKLAERIDEAIQKLTATKIADEKGNEKKTIDVAPRDSAPTRKELVAALEIEARIYRRDAAASKIKSDDNNDDSNQKIDDATLDRQFGITDGHREFLAIARRKQGSATRLTERNIQNALKQAAAAADATTTENHQESASTTSANHKTTTFRGIDNPRNNPVAINQYPQSDKPSSKPDRKNNTSRSSPSSNFRIRFLVS